MGRRTGYRERQKWLRRSPEVPRDRSSCASGAASATLTAAHTCEAAEIVLRLDIARFEGDIWRVLALQGWHLVVLRLLT